MRPRKSDSEHPRKEKEKEREKKKKKEIKGKKKRKKKTKKEKNEKGKKGKMTKKERKNKEHEKKKKEKKKTKKKKKEKQERKRKSANIIRCLWCFTLGINLHDFVTESFNLEHILRDARTVSFCLNTDHISTCLMMFSARFKTAQFWSVLIRGDWRCTILFLSATLGWSTGTENWYGRTRVETWQLLWSPTESAVWIRDWWTSRQLVTDAVACATSHAITTTGNGCNGMHRLSVSQQLTTD